MNKRKYMARLLCGVLITQTVTQVIPSPLTKIQNEKALAYVVGNHGGMSVDIQGINEEITTKGVNKKRGLDVYVQNFKKEGLLTAKTIVCANNLESCDYVIPKFKVPRYNIDIIEVEGETAPRVKYLDTGNPMFNYLIEHQVFSHDILINGEKFTRPLPIKEEVNKSDLLMGLVRAYHGVIEDRPYILSSAGGGDPVPAIKYPNRDVIKQDIFQDNLFIQPMGQDIYYINPNNKRLYMDKACKLGLIKSSDIGKWYEPYEITRYTLRTLTGGILTNEVIDYYSALQLIEKTMRYYEGYINEKDIDVLNFKYGAHIDDNVPEEYKSTIKYLIAKGVIYPDENLSDRDFNINDFVRLLYRVKNKSQRFKIDSVSISPEERKLIDRKYSQMKIKIVNGLGGDREAIPLATEIKALGVKTQKVNITNFLIKDFFTKDVLNYMKDRLGMSDTQSNRQLYLDRFYITIQKYYKTNLLSNKQKSYHLSVSGNDVRIDVDNTNLQWLKDMAKSNNSCLELNSNVEQDLPHFVRFGLEPLQGIYVQKQDTNDDKGTVIYKVGDLNIPKYKARADSALTEFVITQSFYSAKDVGIEAFNYVTEEGETVNLKDGIAKGKVPIAGSKTPKKETIEGVVRYTLQFKVSAMNQAVAIKILHSKLSINRNKYQGYCAVDGYADAKRQNFYVGKTFLEYFGNISCLRDKVLYNRDTGTYCLILDGASTGGIADTGNKEFKSVICGNTIKRYPLDSEELVFNNGGTVFYKMDAIQDLLGGSAFKKMGTKNVFYSDQLADEKLASVYLNSTTPYFLQKDYKITYNKGSYLNMTNANYASDFVIFDMYNIMKAKRRNLNVQMTDDRTSDQNLRMLVKWVWYLPSGDVQEIAKNKNLYLSDIAHLLAKDPKKPNSKALCEINTTLTDKLLEIGLGTEGYNTKYATSGYLMPQITLLSTKDKLASQLQIDEVKKFLYNYVCKYATTRCSGALTNCNTEIEKFDAFNKYMSQKYSDKNETYQFFQTLCPKINKQIMDYGGYIVDSKGSVYQRITGDTKDFNLGNGIMYTGNANKVYVNPFSKASDITSDLQIGAYYQYSGGGKYMYTGKGGSSVMFMKDPATCGAIQATNKYFQIKDITSWDLQKGISVEILNSLQGYRKNDELLRDCTPALDPKTAFESKTKEYQGVIPTDTEIANVEKKTSRNFANVIRITENLSDTVKTVLTNSDWYINNMKEGWVIGVDEEGKPSNTEPYLKNGKGEITRTDIFAPKVTLGLDKYAVRNLANQRSSLADVTKLGGTIVKLGSEDHFSNLSFKHPNFNLAEQWSLSLMSKQSANNYFADKITTVGKIGDVLLTFNGTDRFKLSSGGMLTTTEGGKISPTETTSIMLNDGTQTKSLQDFLYKENDNYYLSKDVKVMEIKASEDGTRCYQLLTNQSGLNAFNLSIPFDMELESGLGKSYRFSYEAYDGEVPTNLTDIIQRAIQYYNEQGNKSKRATIALALIRILFLLIMCLWSGFMLDKSPRIIALFEKLRQEFNIDFLKILTLGMCNLDTEVNLIRISIATLVFMFIQGLILVKYLGLPTY